MGILVLSSTVFSCLAYTAVSRPLHHTASNEQEMSVATNQATTSRSRYVRKNMQKTTSYVDGAWFQKQREQRSSFRRTHAFTKRK